MVARTFARIRIKDVGAVRLQYALAFHRDVLRYTERHRKSFGRTDHRVRDSSIAAGRIQQDLTRSEFTATARLGNDVGSGTIFHRTARVVPLCFPQQFDSWQIVPHAPEPKQRSVANMIQEFLS